jgi:peptidoglycan hydrolase CwlO-like protein
LSGLSVTLWLDMRDIQKSVTTLQAQQKNNDEMREQLWEAMKEMRADIKELLREVRK